MSSLPSDGPFSMAVFSPQSKQPTSQYLTDLRTFIRETKMLEPIMSAINELPKTWSIIASHNQAINELSQGPRYMQMLSDWINRGEINGIHTTMSSILVLPLLTVIQIGQYFQFLQINGMSHSDFLAQLQEGGGMQGYCGGLLPAAAIACSINEDEISRNASKAIHIALCIGAYAELGDDGIDKGPTSMVLRLKYEGQEEELTQAFHGVYVSAITDPKTVSIVGSSANLANFRKYVEAIGLTSQAMHIRGKVHNPENAKLVRELCSIVDQFDVFQLPDASCNRALLRSNISGEVLHTGSLTHEIIYTILASKCQWYLLLTEVARDIRQKRCPPHLFASFGIGDCIPLLPFHKVELTASKLDVYSFIEANAPSSAKTHNAGPKYEYPKDAIAVVGAACRLPGANNLEELWDLISMGQSRAETVPLDRINIPGSFRATLDPKWLASRSFYGNFIDDVDCFDNEYFGVSAREAASMDPQQRILLETAVQAMESSGYLRHHQRDWNDSVGCFIGASFVEYLDNTCANPPTAYTSTGTIRAFLSGKISYHFGWSGPSEVLDTACSSSLVAIRRACSAIQTGECTMALAGGVNVIAGVHNFLDLAKAGFLSPTGQCKPFDAAADGYCRGEGVGLVVLKSLTHALTEGDQILGVIAGAATNQSSFSSGITVPHSFAQSSLYKKVLSRAVMEASQITYVEAHGTGTQAGDPVELASIVEVLGDADRDETMSIGSVKGNMGHLEVAAGVAGLLKTLVMIEKAQLPPLASHKQINPKFGDLKKYRLAFTSKLEPWNQSLRAALINSYGASGSNAAVLLCQGPRPSTEQRNRATSRYLAYPIVLSAHSKDSLLSNAAALRRYIEREDSKVDIADLVFTLAQKRARSKFSWTSTAHDIPHLCQALQGDLNCFDATTQPKKVVLVFSGQSKQTIGLDKSLYDANPLLQYHIGQCNNVMIKAGRASLLPAIFDTTPVTDIVTLQCGTFAMQYACAKCWIDCGLPVDALLGHSFGELTALVVSDILSLPEGLQLIACRASLMQNKWGKERGTMLAIHSSIKVVQEILHATAGDQQDVAIACYNSPRSQVIVGSDASISFIEGVLEKDARFEQYDCQRLHVSHGFHSRFADCIIDDLTAVAATLTFEAPKIPLETCTKDSVNRLAPDHISRHTRHPVYFDDAVRRLEQRLGPCIWLEAGTNSPIIPMVRRAVTASNTHVFEAINITDGVDQSQVLSSVTSNLWREGIDVTYWNFHTIRQPGLKQIWLPPYQFSRQKHCMPFKDHAQEMMEMLAIAGSPNGNDAVAENPQLVAPMSLHSNNEFSLNLSSKRYAQIVSGHAVLGKPLCPASVYLESVLMAIQLSTGSIEDQALCFEDISFDQPLGIDLGRKCTISLVYDSDRASWTFDVRSSSKTDPKSKVVSHAKGKLGFAARTQFQRYQNMISSQIERFADGGNTESLKTNRAYSLFSRVVDYAPHLRGISLITMGKCEAVALIDVPGPEETANESTAFKQFDAVSLDTFIQIAGLSVNSSDYIGSNEVFLAIGIGQISTAIGCDFKSCRSWKVYATFAPMADGKVNGDVHVFMSDGTLVLSMMGIQFTKVTIARFQRSLVTANPKPAQQVVTPDHDRRIEEALASPLDYGSHEPAIHGSRTSVDKKDSEKGQDGNHTNGRLRTLIASLTGAAENKILDDMTLAELGVDSLAATELADELNSEFSSQVKINDLSSMTFRQLCGMISQQEPAENVNIGTSASSSSNGIDTPNGSNVMAAHHGEKIPDKALATSRRDSDREASPMVLCMDPIDALERCQSQIDTAAEKYGFTNYWHDFAPQQDRLLLAFIIEAFRNLGVDLQKFKRGESVPNVAVLPQHTRLIERLWEILGRLGVINRDGRMSIRLSNEIPDVASDVILNDLLQKYPKYRSELNLMAVTGPRIADCVIGKIDPLDLLFGRPASLSRLEDFYKNSPQLATATDILVRFVQEITKESEHGTLRILEVGGGFGGTTSNLASTLENLSLKVEYTFTDVSPMLVRRARKQFSSYPWMDFQTLDCEKDPSSSLIGQYDMIVGTNVIHATTKVVNTLRRLKSLLRIDGFLVLSEVTRVIDWYDLVYGPLDSWWCMQDGRKYPLQSSHYWMSAFKEAGFASTSYSRGTSEDLNSQQLLLASTRAPKGSSESTNTQSRSRMAEEACTVEVFTYKVVDDLQITADVYFPPRTPTQSMPIALMIHGGGFMTLSKKAIRHHQTQFLLRQGILPVSIDYRLCPEVTLVDGPISDVRDACSWARQELPLLAQSRGLSLDSEKIVVVGWSTGGYLALTTGWTSKDLAIKPPLAILSFYGPTDLTIDGAYKSLSTNNKEIHLTKASDFGENVQSSATEAAQDSQQALNKLRLSLPSRPMTSYDSHGSDPTTSWIRPNDARSKFIQAQFRKRNGITDLLHKISDDWSLPPSTVQIHAASPLAQAQNDNYKTPTYIVHSRTDEVVPFRDTEKFIEVLRMKGVEYGFLSLEGVGHIHDLFTAPFTEEWDRGVGPGYEFLVNIVRRSWGDDEKSVKREISK